MPSCTCLCQYGARFDGWTVSQDQARCRRQRNMTENDGSQGPKPAHQLQRRLAVPGPRRVAPPGAAAAGGSPPCRPRRGGGTHRRPRPPHWCPILGAAGPPSGRPTLSGFSAASCRCSKRCMRVVSRCAACGRPCCASLPAGWAKLSSFNHPTHLF